MFQDYKDKSPFHKKLFRGHKKNKIIINFIVYRLLLGHVIRMDDGQIPKRRSLQVKVATGKRDIGYTQLHYIDACKSDVEVLVMNNRI